MVATTTYHWSPISIYKRICCWLNQILTQEIRLVIAIVMPSRHVAKRHRRTLLARQGFAQHDQSPNWSDCNTKYIIISVKGEPRAMIQHDCPDSTLCRTPKVTTNSIDFKGSLWEVQPTLFKCIYIYIYSSWSLYYMSNWIFFGQCFFHSSTCLNYPTKNPQDQRYIGVGAPTSPL